MFTKAYWVKEIKEKPEDGTTEVEIEYVAKQSSTPADATVTGITGTYVSGSAKAEDLDADGSGFKTVRLTFTGSPAINTGYFKDETFFTRN